MGEKILWISSMYDFTQSLFMGKFFPFYVPTKHTLMIKIYTWSDHINFCMK